MPDLHLPAYTVGIDQISDETSLSAGAVRDALNVTFDSDGRARRRPGASRIQGGICHSLWRGNGTAYCVRDGMLCRVTPAGATPIFSLPHVGPLSYTEINDSVVASNASWIGEIRHDDSVRNLGVEDGALVSAVADPIGGLPAGRYGVAISRLRGAEEGGLSRPHFVDVPEGGGIRISLPLASDAETTGTRTYRTTPNGDVLYRSEDFVAGMTEVLIGNTPIGRASENEHLRRSPPGNIVRAWRGRLLIARGRTMYITSPLRFGLYSPRSGYVQEPSTITMIAPVEGGVFIGTRRGVVFYSGSSPKEWIRRQLAAAGPIVGTQQQNIGSDLLNPKLQLGATNQIAVWLSPNGFVLGLPDGSLLQPQSERIALSAQRGHITVVGRQLISVVR